MGITENGLRKLAANKSSMPVMTASGNTKLDSSPGQGSARNPATPPTSASGNTKLDSSPGQGSKRNAATPVLSASGNTLLDSSPYDGEKGRAQQGDMAMTKDAFDIGFQCGMEKAAAKKNEPPAPFSKDVPEGLATRYVQLMRGGRPAGGKGMDPGARAGNTLAGFRNKKTRGEALKSLGARAGTVGALGLGAYGAKKLYDRMTEDKKKAQQ